LAQRQVAHKECSKAVDISAANTFLFITAPLQLVGVKLNNNWHGTEKGQMKKTSGRFVRPFL